MSSPSEPSPLLPAGRMKWVWLAIAGAIGVWLMVLLLVSGPERDPAHDGAAPEAAPPRNPTFDSPAANAFTQRHPVKASRPLPSFPVAPNQGKRE